MPLRPRKTETICAAKKETSVAESDVVGEGKEELLFPVLSSGKKKGEGREHPKSAAGSLDLPVQT